MRTIPGRPAIAAVWLIAAGAVLLGMGFLAEITTPPNSGANIGAAGFFLLGLYATGAGLLVGVAAAVVRLRRSAWKRLVPFS
ncbi:hypothetical protein [Amycolatopsis jiangsuensis]|uniref:Uncharacterized protein n=1 Tax=Amycolatopsis jiangsuensis TaxID=1181879 RepID=A0A840J1J4_9PSEU|nr:hypothetical protein [Amycolatopsis jiangsuensis]MBB4687793.1 hypothetical protein [Amycolatopsis jiangsuensis]